MIDTAFFDALVLAAWQRSWWPTLLDRYVALKRVRAAK
jgi:hypothetical protein